MTVALNGVFFARLSMQALLPLRNASCNFLAESAALLRQWCHVDDASTDYLRGHNDVDCVLLLSGTGPRYILKSQTVNCKRLHKKLYFDHSCANSLLPLMLEHQGRSEPVFLGLTRNFVAAGHPCAMLGTRNRHSRRRLMDAVCALGSVQALHKKLLDKCTEEGEWSIISHDATFKSLFSIVGQKKMAQSEGEFHALHTILGKSGALPAMSLQRSEGPACFAAACREILPDCAREGTRWVFTDIPDTAHAARDVFPNLAGIAEDPLHLVLRVEQCYGERRTILSRQVLRLQRKFHLPHTTHAVYAGGPPRAGEEGRVFCNMYQKSFMYQMLSAQCPLSVIMCACACE